MMPPAIVIRPEPGCAASVAALCGMGCDARGFPLFQVGPVAWEAPDPAGFDALLAGSANVFRHGGAGLAGLTALPVHAVGEATAAAARAAGFTIASIGEGGLQAVLDRVPAGHRRLLRLAGAARVELAAPPGVAIADRVVYASEPRAMPDALAAQLRDPTVVLVHSAEAARHLAFECDRTGVDRAPLSIAAIGPRVAAAAGSGWGRIAVSRQASDAALLALAAEMCQGHDRAPTGEA